MNHGLLNKPPLEGFLQHAMSQPKKLQHCLTQGLDPFLYEGVEVKKESAICLVFVIEKEDCIICN